MAILIPTFACAAEFGFASWYGEPFHGRPAADGSTYDMEQTTAAHRTLPLGTRVRVHNLENGKTIDVRITDRGPFIDGRVIDLSRAAARAIDVIQRGTARVQLEILEEVNSNEATILPAVLRAPVRNRVAPAAAPDPVITEDAASDEYAVQVGAFGNRTNAERFRDSMEGVYGTARIVQRGGLPVIWRVVVGSAHDTASAQQLVAKVQANGGRALLVHITTATALAVGQ